MTTADPTLRKAAPAPARRRSRTRGASVQQAQRELRYELASGLTGVALAVFMWGHMMLVGSILTGERGFDWLAAGLEHIYIAQPTVIAISVIFLLHAALASRKIPSQLRERKALRELGASLSARGTGFDPHLESSLWPWQVWTGMTLLVFGSFHLVLIGIDVLTPLFGERTGIEAATSMSRVNAGLWIVYAVMLLCVEFHASVGLYRFAVKWGVGARLGRPALRAIERVLLVGFLGLGAVTLVVLGGWIDPPLAFLLGETP